MIWRDVIKEYGVELSKKMSKSKWLNGITVSIIDCPDCISNLTNTFERKINIKCKICKGTGKVIDIPKSDIDKAYRSITGNKINVGDWD